jgi:hypothetical protein
VDALRGSSLGLNNRPNPTHLYNIDIVVVRQYTTHNKILPWGNVLAILTNQPSPIKLVGPTVASTYKLPFFGKIANDFVYTL